MEKIRIEEIPYIGNLIDSGGYGFIYDIGNDELLKLFYARVFNKTNKQLFENINNLANINIPKLITPKKLVIDKTPIGDTVIGYTMDYIKKDDKKVVTYTDFYKRKALKTKLIVLADITKTLEQIHNNGLIVNDFKCDNIVLKNLKEACFIDCDTFLFKEIEKSPINIYMYYYYYHFNKRVSQNSDLFCLGAIILESIIEYRLSWNILDTKNIKNIINRTVMPYELEQSLLCLLSDSNEKEYIYDLLLNSSHDPKIKKLTRYKDSFDEDK